MTAIDDDNDGFVVTAALLYELHGCSGREPRDQVPNLHKLTTTMMTMMIMMMMTMVVMVVVVLVVLSLHLWL